VSHSVANHCLEENAFPNEKQMSGPEVRTFILLVEFMSFSVVGQRLVIQRGKASMHALGQAKAFPLVALPMWMFYCLASQVYPPCLGPPAPSGLLRLI
jgi:hypothetical protein